MAKNRSKQNGKGGGKVALAALFNVFGTLMLAGVIALAAPLSVPQMLGFGVYDVVSGSMEPEIPLGSAVLSKPVEAADVQEGDIIVFQDGEGGMITHRVVTNRTSLGEFVTKGDANEMEDINPAPYEAYVGRVEAHVPVLGGFMAIYSTTMGKVYLLLAAACGVMFNMLATRMRRDAKTSRYQAARSQMLSSGAGAAGAQDGMGADSPGLRGETAMPAPRRRPLVVLRNAAIAVLAAVFLGSGGYIAYTNWQYGLSDALYADAAERYTGHSDDASAAEKPPIDVDFEALQASNPDVVGWIYCEGTAIDYPVVQGRDNDQYLHHDYTGSYNIDGSIFVDGDNRPGFADSNTIVYGHHMNSGSMFAGLVDWADQGFYEQHPVVWLLTPERNYKLVVFSAHHADARSSFYDIIATPNDKFDQLLADATSLSDITVTDASLAELSKNSFTLPESTASNLKMNPLGRYVMLTTCAYLFDNDRYVLHAALVPVA